VDRGLIGRLSIGLAAPLTGGSRRTALRRLVTDLLGGAALPLGLGGGAANKKKKKHYKGHKGHKHHHSGKGGGGGGDTSRPDPVPAGHRKVIGYYVGYEVDDTPVALADVVAKQR
jgi:hypothetical protein